MIRTSTSRQVFSDAGFNSENREIRVEPRGCACSRQQLGHLKRFAAVMLALLFVLAAPLKSRADDMNWGKVGEPIHLNVHHACCFAAVWSGYVVRGKELWKKYFPAGSTVDFQYGLQSAITVNQMLAGKAGIGYGGDLVGLTAVTKERVADLRLIGVSSLSWDQCNVLLVRKDAPKFANSIEAIKWVDGKKLSTPKGSCTDNFVQRLFEIEKIKPASYLNQNIEVIASGFRAGRLDAAAIWEPNASNIVLEGLARRVASGQTIGHSEAAFLMVRADLLKQRPDIVKGWLQAELDAQLFIADPKNAMEVVRMVKPYVTGFSDKALWYSLYGTYPESEGGTKARLVFPFVFNDDAMKVVDKGVAFLRQNKVIHVDRLRQDAIVNSIAEEVLKERGLKSPIATIAAQPDSAFKEK